LCLLFFVSADEDCWRSNSVGLRRLRRLPVVATLLLLVPIDVSGHAFAAFAAEIDLEDLDGGRPLRFFGGILKFSFVFASILCLLDNIAAAAARIDGWIDQTTTTATRINT